MSYGFFLFTKLYDNFFCEDDDLEYDLLFDKLVGIYRDYQLSTYNDNNQDEYSCITYYFKNRQRQLEDEQHS
jgi:hypothetical protein